MFDRTLAIRLGFCCQYAYAKSDFLNNQLGIKPPPDPFTCCDTNQPPTSFATLFDFGAARVVAFQGTITRKFPDIAKYNFDAALDWLQNFRIQLIGSEQLAYHVPGRVHEGFALQLNWIYPAIKQELAKQADKPVYVTGHSQGGAVAAIATKALVNDGFRVAATYTFAAPRAGDVQFASAVETEVHRLEFGDDIVPHVPMRTSFPWWMTEAVEKAKVDARVKQLLDYLAKSADPSYTPVGLLTYARPDEAPHFDLTAAEDAELATMRRMHLLFAGANLANHHHMFNYLHHILGVDMNTAMNQDAAVAVAGGLATGGITGGITGGN